MDLEVLVATVGQADCSLAEKMNIKTSAVIANQGGSWRYEEADGGRVRMVTTDTKGVGINRNLALQLAKGDILLFADDDVTYYDGTLQGVRDAFRQLPDADVIFFGIDMTRDAEVFDKRRNKTRRVHLWNSLRYGAARMAIRREAVLKHRLAFSTLFGGGCPYSSGEDTILIRDCFRAGLRVYSHSYVLGRCAKDTSSWFSGYNDKYFFDRGATVACAFPKTKHLMKWHFAYSACKKTGVPIKKILQQMDRGIRAYPALESYREETTVMKSGDP